MKRLSYLVATVLLLFLTAVVGNGQTPGQNASQSGAKSARIAAITVTGTQKFPKDQIIAAGGLKPGDVVTAEQIQGAADRLSALGIFSSVNFRFSTKDDAISLEYRVQETQTYPLSFDNFPWYTDEEIAQAIHQQDALFVGETPDGGLILDEILTVIDDLLAAKKVKGLLTHQLLARPVGEGMMMQFRVDAPELKIRSVQFGDFLASNSELVKDRIPDLKGQLYSRFAIEMFENEHVRPLYASKGFLRAKIGPPEVRLAGDGDPTNIGVEVVIPVTPGPIYSFSGITWQGNSAIPSTNLDGAVQLKAGDTADGMKMEALWQAIQSTYASHGYLDAKLEPQPHFDDVAHRVSYRLAITEGAQYHMGEMMVTGLSLDAEKRLRQVWLIAPGQVFDETYFEKVAKDLAKPSVEMFGEMPVHYTVFGDWLRPDPDKHTVDVLLDFK